jgi:hypothetical protein
MINPVSFNHLKWALTFYGPNDREFETYLRQNKIKEDDKMKYLRVVLDYWFV